MTIISKETEEQGPMKRKNDRRLSLYIAETRQQQNDKRASLYTSCVCHTSWSARPFVVTQLDPFPIVAADASIHRYRRKPLYKKERHDTRPTRSPPP